MVVELADGVEASESLAREIEQAIWANLPSERASSWSPTALCRAESAPYLDPGDLDCSHFGFTDASLGGDPLLVLGIAAVVWTRIEQRCQFDYRRKSASAWAALEIAPWHGGV